ncbi:hypothetical protein TWF730_005615 [Orbilia blumenaviensis]|uniref:Uncharacterized protein n=1 Tax=Orbilia blumenaviensis TaxID=1796055 RepID=A0AAV9VM49_9PEZI
MPQDEQNSHAARWQIIASIVTVFSLAKGIRLNFSFIPIDQTTSARKVSSDRGPRMANQKVCPVALFGHVPMWLLCNGAPARVQYMYGAPTPASN